jgi:hypothetical protein
VTDSLAFCAAGRPGTEPPGAEPVPLSLPAADLAVVVADIAAAPAVRWLRALTSWAGTGRPVAESARITAADMAEVSALLGFDDAAEDERALLVDIAVRWAVDAGVLLLRTGILRAAKRHLPLLGDPAALWLRMRSALDAPDMVFTDLLDAYSGCHYASFSPGRDVARLTLAFVEAGSLDEAQLAAWYAGRWSPGHLGAKGMQRSAHMLALLASALGILVKDGDGRWIATGLGRVCATLTLLPRAELDDGDFDAAGSLIGVTGSQAAPGFVLKVSLSRLGVWRRLRIPGELTAYGLHTVIQAAFGWGGDHLHTLRAGPFTFAPSWPVLEEAVPSELVTLADLGTLGVRELAYRYDLGDCWDHVIIVESIAPAGEVVQPECLAGRGVTPAEDGGDWLEDEDGNLVPVAEPEPERVYDRARINSALALALGELDEREDLVR